MKKDLLPGVVGVQKHPTSDTKYVTGYTRGTTSKEMWDLKNVPLKMCGNPIQRNRMEKPLLGID